MTPRPGNGRQRGWLVRHPLLRRYLPLVHEDLVRVYARDLHKWLIDCAHHRRHHRAGNHRASRSSSCKSCGRPVLRYYLRTSLGHCARACAGLCRDRPHHAVVHARSGRALDRRDHPLVSRAPGRHRHAAVFGQAAGGHHHGWIWRQRGAGRAQHLRRRRQSARGCGRARAARLRLDARDRRIMLICGAAAGMSAVFRAPLTGIVFALEMPYKRRPGARGAAAVADRLRRFVCDAQFFSGQRRRCSTFSHAVTSPATTCYWSALLGLLIGLIAMAFVVTFRRAREFLRGLGRAPLDQDVRRAACSPACAACCFCSFYNGSLVPLGPNYEAVGIILHRAPGPAAAGLQRISSWRPPFSPWAQAASAPCLCRCF